MNTNYFQHRTEGLLRHYFECSINGDWTGDNVTEIKQLAEYISKQAVEAVLEVLEERILTLEQKGEGIPEDALADENEDAIEAAVNRCREQLDTEWEFRVATTLDGLAVALADEESQRQADIKAREIQRAAIDRYLNSIDEDDKLQDLAIKAAVDANKKALDAEEVLPE